MSINNEEHNQQEADFTQSEQEGDNPFILSMRHTSAEAQL